MFDAPCLMRSAATQALDRAGIPWRIAFTSRSLNGVWAAVNAGLGVTVRTAAGLPPGLAPLAPELLPALGQLGVVLHRAEISLPPPCSGWRRSWSSGSALIFSDRLLAAQLAPFAPAPSYSLTCGAPSDSSRTPVPPPSRRSRSW